MTSVLRGVHSYGSRLFGGEWFRPNVLDGVYLHRAVVACLAAQWMVCGFFLLSLLCVSPATQARLYGAILAVVVLSVGMVQILFLTGRVRWCYLLALGVVDFLALSAAVAVGGGFRHDYLYLFYFPVAACCGILSASLRVNLAWCTAVALTYVSLCLWLDGGIDLWSRDGLVLLARVLVMYMVNVMLTLSCALERMRWRDASLREEVLIEERSEFSRWVHDSTAQLAFMVSLGLEAAVYAARDGGMPVLSRLQATSELARVLVWQVRELVNVGGIYVGERLESAIRFHVVSFANVTSVRSEFLCCGAEPELPVVVKRVLFTFAHNALANAYRHAGPNLVLVELRYGRRDVRLVVLDDGCGLPADYDRLGHGFSNMSQDLSRVGGRLFVHRVGRLGGATVGCVVPIAGRLRR